MLFSNYVKNILTIIVFTTLINGCSSVGPSNMVELEAREYIDSLDVVIVKPEDQIYSTLSKGNGARTALMLSGGGLAGLALSNVVRNADNRLVVSKITELNHDLGGFNYPEIMLSRIEEEIGFIDWAQVNDMAVVERQPEMSFDYMREAITKSSKSSAVLIMQLDYKIAGEFESIKVNLKAQVYPTIPELNQYKEFEDEEFDHPESFAPIFSDNFSYTVKYNAPMSRFKKDDHAERVKIRADYLLENDSERVKVALMDSIPIISNQLFDGLTRLR